MSSISSAPPSSSNPSSSSNSLHRKLNKVLEIRTNSPELLSSLENLSSFYGKNSLSSRRNLRSDIEKRNLQVNQRFLSAFEQVYEQLEQVEKTVNNLKECCDSMEGRLNDTRAAAGKIILDANELQLQRQRNKIKEDIVKKFMTKFQLTNEESTVLRTGNISKEFFSALERVHQIHKDCKLLLRTKHQRAGLEIMELMSMYEQSAYDRLYRWVEGECRAMEVGSPMLNPLMQYAACTLHNRPLLLSYCLQEVEKTRSSAVQRCFLNALTAGGPGGTPKPIEMHAHDSKRYVREMLGWIHQSVATEFELLCSLFGRSPTKKGQQEQHDQAEEEQSLKVPTNYIPEEERKEHIGRVLSKIFEGICRPFRARFDQVVSSQSGSDGITICYNLSNIVDFYLRTIHSIIERECLLLTSLKECKNLSLQQFKNLLQRQGDLMLLSPPSPPPSLTPPQVVFDAVNRLKEIMDEFNQSTVPVEQRPTSFAPVLSAVLDPLTRVCQLSATSLNKPTDMAVYLINCLSLLQSPLTAFDFTAQRVEMLAAQIDGHMDTMIEEETTQLLSKLRLLDLVKAVQDKDQRIPLSKKPGCDQSSVITMMTDFEAVLARPDTLVLAQCDKLINTRMRSSARNGVCRQVHLAYINIYESLHDASNGYANVGSFVQYTPDQIKTMVDAF